MDCSKLPRVQWAYILPHLDVPVESHPRLGTRPSGTGPTLEGTGELTDLRIRAMWSPRVAHGRQRDPRRTAGVTVCAADRCSLSQTYRLRSRWPLELAPAANIQLPRRDLVLCLDRPHGFDAGDIRPPLGWIAPRCDEFQRAANPVAAR